MGNTVFTNNRKAAVKVFVSRHAALLVLIVLCVVAMIAVPNFLSYNILLARLQGYCMIGLAALGLTFVILTGGMDLSVGGVGCICGFFAAFLEFQNPVLSLIVPVLAGVGIGLLNGFLVTRMKAPAFVITLGTMSACEGFALIVNDEKAYTLQNEESALYAVGHNNFLGFPIMCWIFVIAAVICIIVAKYTKFGRSVFAVGGNEEAARMMGFRPERVKLACYAICGGLCGLAGMMLCSRVGVAQTQAGSDWIMTALAAVVIGGTLLEGGRGSFGGTVCGVLIYSMIEFLLGRLSLLASLIKIITACILLAVVLLQYRNTRAYAKKKKPTGKVPKK